MGKNISDDNSCEENGKVNCANYEPPNRAYEWIQRQGGEEMYKFIWGRLSA